MKTEFEGQIRNNAYKSFLDFIKNIQIVKDGPNPITEPVGFQKREVAKSGYQLLYDALENHKDVFKDYIQKLPIQEPLEFPANVISIAPHRPWQGQEA
jgi:hypothetical protein